MLDLEDRAIAEATIVICTNVVAQSKSILRLGIEDDKFNLVKS